MPWRKKVKQMKYTGENRETASYTAGEVNDKDKANQEHYEKKVKDLLKCCKQFEKSLKNIKSINEFTAEGIEVRFKINFRVFLKKTISKTKRVLNDMDKKLKKLGRKPLVIEGKDEKNNTIKKIDDDLIAKIKNAFEYDAPKDGWDKDTIDYAAIYDKVVYEFFNNKDNKPLRLFNAIDDLAKRALQRIEKESQKNVAVWVGKKLNVIKAKIKEMKGTLQAAEVQLGNAGQGLQATAGNLQGNGSGPNKGKPNLPFLSGIKKSNPTGGASAVGQGSDATDKRYEQEIERLKKQIEELTKKAEGNLIEALKNREFLKYVKKLIGEMESQKATGLANLSAPGASTKFPILSFKSRSLTGLAVEVKQSDKISDKIEDIKQQGSDYLSELSGKISADKKNEAAIEELVFEQLEDGTREYYSVQEYIDNCKGSIKGIEDAFNSIADSIDDSSNEDAAERSINSLLKAIEGVGNDIKNALTQAEKLSKNFAKLDKETEEAYEKRKEPTLRVLGDLQEEVGKLQADLKRIGEYGDKTLAKRESETVKMIKQYKSISKRAEQTIEQERRISSASSLDEFSRDVKNIKVAISGIQDAMFDKTEFDDFSKKLSAVKARLDKEKKDKEKGINVNFQDPDRIKMIKEKDDSLVSINTKITALKNAIDGNAGAISKVTLFNNNLEGRKYPESKEGAEQKEIDKKVKAEVVKVNEILEKMAKTVSNMMLSKNKETAKTLGELGEKKESLNGIQAQIEEMEKMLFKAAGKSDDQFDKYQESVGKKKGNIKKMNDKLNEFKKAGDAVVKIANEKFEEKKVNRIFDDYKESFKKLLEIPEFKNLKPGSAPPPPPKGLPTVL